MKALIPAENVSSLQKKISKLIRRAQRNNLPPMELVLGETKAVRKYPSTDAEMGSLALSDGWIEYYQEVELTGVMPVIEGWSFVAKIEHTPEGNMVKSMDPAVSMAYTELKPHCEHCKSNRRRKETYILKNEKEIQVGTECIKNYMSLNNAEYILMLAEATKYFRESEDYEDDFRVGRKIAAAETIDFIATAVQCVMKYGWQPSSYRDNESGTGAKTFYHLTAIRDRDFQDREIDPCDRAKELAKAYIEELLVAGKQDNAFMHNIQIVLKLGFVTRKESNMMAVCAKNILQAEADRKAKAGLKNEYFGNVKDKVTVEVTITKRIGFDTNWGSSMLFIMQDDEGRQFKTVNAGSFNAQLGDKVKIKGTIKAQEEYKGIKQTVLTRVKEVVAAVQEAV